MVTTAPVTIEQAAALLNVSASTIRRRIRRGELRVEETHRPQGVVWLVHLPAGTTSVSPDGETATVDTTPVATTATTSAASETMVALIQATVREAVTPLVEALERQAVEIGTLREDRGRLTAELDRAAGTVVALGDELERLKRPEPPTEARTEPAAAAPSTDAPFASMGRWWLRLALAFIGAILLAGVLLGWPR